MEDERIERLSGLIDGDLTPAEERDLRARLESDPVLAADLTALTEIRRSLAALATREQAPAVLDTLVEPLLQGRPEPITIRPWVRWLAAAAIVIVGLTGVFEIYFGHLAGTVEDKLARQDLRPAAEPTQRFALAPLPTSSVPPEKQLIEVGETEALEHLEQIGEIVGPLAVVMQDQAGAVIFDTGVVDEILLLQPRECRFGQRRRRTQNGHMQTHTSRNRVPDCKFHVLPRSARSGKERSSRGR